MQYRFATTVSKKDREIKYRLQGFLSSSVQFSRSVMSNSLPPHESQHTRPPCPSSTPGVHSNSCPLSWWCHPAISSSVVPFSSCPQSLPASESFPVSQLFAWGGQSSGVSALASFLPKKSQGWSPSEWTGWISLQSKGRTFVGKVMSLLFNMLSRLVITFLPRSKHLLVSWLQSPSEVWQNVAHWRREWPTTSVFLPWEPHEQYEKAKW